MEKLQFDNKRSRVQVCPCGKSNKDGKFIPYKGFDQCGYCHSCGETFLPKLQSDNTEQWQQSEAYKAVLYVKPSQEVISIAYDLFYQTLDEKHYAKNTFIRFLFNFFKKEEVYQALDMYHIGTCHDQKNASMYWYLDEKNICRAKAMLYDIETCKAPFNHAKGICKRQKDNQYATIELTKSLLKKMGKESSTTPRCFFGAHLLQYAQFKDFPIGIVEAEKTAVIASICKPDTLWLATGGLQRLDLELFNLLKGKEIWIYPDLGLPNPKTQLTPYQVWANKLEAIKRICGEQVFISTLLEKEGSPEERIKGYDLADYYLTEYRNQFQ
jgi:Domain of unknown function (DUF6371)